MFTWFPSHSLDFLSGLIVGRFVGSRHDDVLQIGVDGGLVDFDHLLEDFVFLTSSSLLHLSSSGLLRLPNAAFSLGQHGEGVDAAFFLEANELFSEEIEHVAGRRSFQVGNGLVDKRLFLDVEAALTTDGHRRRLLLILHGLPFPGRM